MSGRLLPNPQYNILWILWFAAYYSVHLMVCGIKYLFYYGIIYMATAISFYDTWKYIMRFLYQILSLSPAPLFFLGFIYSLYSTLFTKHFCQSHLSQWEMPVMWFIMFLAHCIPWILFWQQRNFTRD